MTDQPCRTTRHCADHGFCHRCAPLLAEGSRHLVKAIAAAGVSDKHAGYVYARLADALSAPIPRHTCCGSSIGHHVGCPASDTPGAAQSAPTVHHCGNCEGVDPDTCLTNPDRPTEESR